MNYKVGVNILSYWITMYSTYSTTTEITYIHRRIYYEANEASASGPHHLGGPHQNYNAVSKADFFYFVKIFKS